jgi:hypothetical protein
VQFYVYAELKIRRAAATGSASLPVRACSAEQTFVQRKETPRPVCPRCRGPGAPQWTTSHRACSQRACPRPQWPGCCGCCARTRQRSGRRCAPPALHGLAGSCWVACPQPRARLLTRAKHGRHGHTGAPQGLREMASQGAATARRRPASCDAPACRTGPGKHAVHGGPMAHGAAADARPHPGPRPGERLGGPGRPLAGRRRPGAAALCSARGRRLGPQP